MELYMDARSRGEDDRSALQSVAAGLGEELGPVLDCLRGHVALLARHASTEDDRSLYHAYLRAWRSSPGTGEGRERPSRSLLAFAPPAPALRSRCRALPPAWWCPPPAPRREQLQAWRRRP